MNSTRNIDCARFLENYKKCLLKRDKKVCEYLKKKHTTCARVDEIYHKLSKAKAL